MKRSLSISIAIIAITCLSAFSNVNTCHRKIDPVVSTQWLSSNLNSGLVMLDLRSSDAYEAGHIPNTINSPVAGWWTTRDELLLELLDEESLRTKIGELGIDASKKVVLTNTALNDFDRAQTNRVAWTLIYAGIANVAILDGGYTKWVAEGREITQYSLLPEIIVYTGKFRTSVLISKASVMRNLCSARIIDARIPEDFFGVTTPRQYSEKDGHIAGAVSLPTPWTFTSEGLYKDRDTLEAMVHGVIEQSCHNSNKRIIIYCGVGGFASTLWFIMSEVLGYENASLYDGSIQEWTRDPNAPVQKFKW
jgi:thiosulfate/3-mercaptopyruvate sulfurtransferase